MQAMYRPVAVTRMAIYVNAEGHQEAARAELHQCTVISHIHVKKEVVISINLGSKAIHQAINQRPEQKDWCKVRPHRL